MFEQIKRLWADDSAATAVEYGLIVAAIAAVIIATVISLGGKVNNSFAKVDSNMPQ